MNDGITLRWFGPWHDVFLGFLILQQGTKDG